MSDYKAEYVQVSTRGADTELSKFDKEARMFYSLTVPEVERHGGAGANTVSRKLSQEQLEFLSTGSTPAEQRILRDPTYHRAVEKLMEGAPADLKAEREAILKSAQSSHLEPYDYQLSLRHQAFNSVIHRRSDANASISEIDWLKEVAPAQYHSQQRQDPSFSPETRQAIPDWVRTLQTEPERSDVLNHSVSEPERPCTNLSNPATKATTTASEILGQSTTVIQAQTESGVYRGPVIAETEDLLFQRLSPKSVVVHSRELFETGQAPTMGQPVSVKYSQGKPSTTPLKDREQSMGLGR